MRKTWAAFLPALLILAACSAFSAATPGALRQSEERHLADFAAIAVANSIQAHVEVGGAPSVVVKARPDLLVHVLTTVVDGRLSVFTDQLSTTFGDVDVVISVPSLETIETGTSAAATVDGIDSEHLSVSASDSSTITAAGVASEIEVVATTGAAVHLGELKADRARVDVGTSALAEIAATGLVFGSAHESGEIRLLGNPSSVQIVTNSSGRVVRSS